MDLSRDDYIRGQIENWRIRKQVNPPDKGQMILPGMGMAEDAEATPAGSWPPKLTKKEIETGLRGIAAARQVLAEQQARKAPPPKPEGGPRVVIGSRAISRITSFTNGHSPSIESDDNGSK